MRKTLMNNNNSNSNRKTERPNTESISKDAYKT